ncbi:hypothetical protein DENSPDRAFT_886022 [Dentipellis sp. KUC8613]|nr:hypothetical protein DENSPDRAFT_886022 [Dentipellis sp. KUC8613]
MAGGPAMTYELGSQFESELDRFDCRRSWSTTALPGNVSEPQTETEFSLHPLFAAVRTVHVLHRALHRLRSPYTPSLCHTRRRRAARAILAASAASSCPVRTLDMPFTPSSSPPPAVHVVNAPPSTCLRRAPLTPPPGALDTVRTLYAASSHPRRP